MLFVGGYLSVSQVCVQQCLFRLRVLCPSGFTTTIFYLHAYIHVPVKYREELPRIYESSRNAVFTIHVLLVRYDKE